VPFAGAGEPWAWVCVVWAGGFCDENLELILDIHDVLRILPLESGGVKLPGLSALPRPSSVGRLGGIFWGGVVGLGCEFCAAGFWGAGTVEDAGASLVVGTASWWGWAGRPPCDDVFGGASLVRPGEEGACWRWWWSIRRALLVRPSHLQRHSAQRPAASGQRSPRVSGSHL